MLYEDYTLYKATDKDWKLTLTSISVRDVLRHIVIIKWLALFAILPSRVVLTIVADSTGHSARSLVDRLVEVAGIGMVVTITWPTCVRLFAHRGFPWQVVVEVLALLAIETLGVVRTLASAVDHVLLIGDSW